jgi:hypothetical protein
VTLDPRLSMALLAFSTLAAGREAKSPSPMLTLLVYNYAQAPVETLAQAELEAGRILGEAGVRAVWLDCLDGHPAADQQVLCIEPLEPADVVIRVLPGQAQNGSPDTLGIAFLPTVASVYYEYAVGLAKSDDVEVEIELSTILGCAIAHEVGHLLLGPNNHSIAGIMRGKWKTEQLRLALKGCLLFTYRQSKLIQTEARRRMRLQTGSPKEHPLATVDQQTEHRVILQSD